MRIFDVVRTRAGQAFPRSLYAETHPAPERVALAGDLRVDIAVVGGGILGLSTALALAERGVSCCVLEANAPGWGASGRNGGQVNSGLKWPPSQVERDLGSEAVTFSHAAPTRLKELVARLGIDCDYANGGGYRAALDPAAMRELEVLGAEFERRNIPVRMMDADGMAAAAGTPAYAGGLYDPVAGQVNPLKYVRGLAAAASAAGARVFSDTPVTAAVRDGDWRLTTPHGTVRADKVLFATNGYSDATVPGLRGSLLPVFSTIVATRPLPEALRARILAGREVLYETGLQTTYYRVDAGGRLLFGGRGPQAPASGPGAAKRLTRLAEALWPGVAEVGWDHGWNGRIAMTGDHYPHVHEVAETGLVCAGFNGRGVALTTALGPRLAARLVAGEDLPLPVTPIRRVPFQPFWPAGVAAVLAWHDLTGRSR
ncbi:NAD(P)/FAD-dependent oxidoreductase [Pseudooceanicola sp. LIPI14-2-Ac024]|uniref:NAD(P)/FAD-dependent oxidoreductase n=1 Tax=Pseudooceanicola sp. LIPI14-2-Ac024 TaxID=3344875 RepID=UPI0035D06A3F